MRLLALGLMAAVFTPPAVAARGEDTVLAELLAETRVERLDVHPVRLEIDGRYESAQVLVFAHLEDGSVIDATRAASLESTPACLAIDDQRLARGLEDGDGELVFLLGDARGRVPVSVRGQGRGSEPSFVSDVMPQLSRLGCNAGTCHGADKGQNGFKLSLRGYDPLFDHAALTDDLSGRRFDRVDPAQSLFLQKPTGGVPHQGGVRLDIASRDYELLRDWVARGARINENDARVTSIRIMPEEPTIPRPGMSQQFAVLATYGDGSERDVTAQAFFESSDIEVATADTRGRLTALRRGESALLARYEGRYSATRTVVMGDREGWQWPEVDAYNWIDELVHEKLRRMRSQPGELCTDEEFLRRVKLDLTGLPPTPREVRTFLLDRRTTRAKREELLIDRLIGSAAFVEHWTNKWCDLLQVNPKFLGGEGATQLRQWVRANVASNQPYDEFVHELLTASGSTHENPAAGYYKVLREPDLVMENTTQLFLGVRFSCNKCHDHPFERWTQDQHWELAAFFARVGRENVEGARILTGGIAEEERISDRDEGEVMGPRSAKPVKASFPFEHGGAIPAEGSRRARLAAWMTATENPYFATSYANRLWSYFLGVGLIEPVDDIRASNPASNPALLERLTRELVGSGFDVRSLMRTICRSRTYQQSVATNRWNADDSINFSHALARRLPAEVLFDAIHQATGARLRLPGQRVGTRAAELDDPRVETRDGFLALFGRPPRESACECERTGGMSLGQALSLVNGPTLADAINDPANALVELLDVEDEPRVIVEELYLSFLGRFPSEDELAELAPTLDPGARDNRHALDPQGLVELERRYAAWESATHLPEWVAADVRVARSTEGATLTIGEDGAVLASGSVPETDTTTLVVWTETARLGGPRLEALPDESLAASGPGRAENGNFVLNELSVVIVPAGDPRAAHEVKLARATAGFSQGGYPVGATIDGKPETGWAVMPQFGKRHEAVFALAEPLDTPAGAVLLVTLDQRYGQKHTLGHFRLSVTETKDPRAAPFPEPVIEALLTLGDQRTEGQRDVLHRYFIGTDGEMAKRIRLAATRDLAWALANSPAFLFNR